LNASHVDPRRPQINLTVVHLFMGVIINSAVAPIVLAMFWDRLTGLAMVAGSIGGTVLALIAWLSVTATYDGGLGMFRMNSSTVYSFTYFIRF